MKTKKIIFTFLVLISTKIVSYAQTDVDAFRYSGGSITGTARFTAMSGAFGALGGDFTSLSYNPAGIAVYRSSEFTFTPSIYVSSNTSRFLGTEINEDKYNFNIGNTGLIYTRILSENPASDGWKSWNFGIGYNRLNNFHNRSFYEALNPSNSLLDNYVENSNGVSPGNLNAFYEFLAFEHALIDTVNANNYFSVIPDGGVMQRRSSETRGAIGETVFSFGANYSNRFYFGATLGFKSLRYVESTTYEERDPDTSIVYFKNLRFQQDLTTKGSGFDLKVGMIIRATDAFRIGFAVKTPSWYTMHDIYKNTLESNVDSGSALYYRSESPDGIYDYDYTSPFKAMAGVAVVIGKSGLISADYEFSDFSEARFNAGGSPFSDVNSLIRNKYGETHTVRIGTEWNYQNLVFRGGYAMTTSPLKEIYKAGTADYSRKSYSGGIGYREKNMFLDVGYVYTTSEEFFQPYTLSYEDVPGVRSDVITSNFILTLGVKF